jgi:spore germination protein YaaH
VIIIKRPLRLGSTGPRVVQLQKALVSLGYEVGKIDGMFGYQTRDALCQMQTEFRLRVDGIAGRQVYELLSEPKLKSRRIVHIVKPGETLLSIAGEYRTGVEYLRRNNRFSSKREVYPGQRLVINESKVLGVIPRIAGPQEIQAYIGNYHTYLSGVVTSEFYLDAEGGLSGKPDPEGIKFCLQKGVSVYGMIHHWDQNQSDNQIINDLLKRKRLQERLLGEIERIVLIPGIRGFLFDFGQISFGLGQRYRRFIAEAAEKLHKKGLEVYVSLPVFAKGVKGGLGAADLNLSAINEIADGIILQTHRLIPWSRGPLPFWVLEDRISSFSKAIPVWKGLLGISLGGWEYNHSTKEGRYLSYQQAKTLAYLKGVKLRRDENWRMLTGEYQDEGSNRQIWIEDAISLETRLALFWRYKLGGLLLFPLSPTGGDYNRPLFSYIKAGRYE